MFDCADIEARELLPELASGRLDAATRARVEAHLGACAECASELETLRLVRAAYAPREARIDAAAIVAALPRPAGPRRAPRGRPTPAWAGTGMRGRSSGWRLAAAVAAIAVAGAAMAVATRTDGDGPRLAERREAPASAERAPDGGSPAEAPPRRAPSPVPGAPGTAAPRATLASVGGVSDLDADGLTALLAAIDEIEAAPLEEPEQLAPVDAPFEQEQR